MAYRKLKLGLLFLLLTVCCFSFPVNAYSLHLDAIKVHILKGDYESAITAGEKVMAEAEFSPDLDQLYYLLALSYLKDGNYLRASDIFEIIMKEFKNSPFSEEAEIGLGDAYFLMGEYDRAEGYYKGFLKEHRGSKFKPQVLYRTSLSAAKLGRIEESGEYLEKLNREYPFNVEAAVEKDLGGSGELYYTVQVGAFKNADNAKSLTRELIHKGYPAYIEESALGRKVSCRVRVGRSSLRQEALDLEKRLMDEGYPANITCSRR